MDKCCYSKRRAELPRICAGAAGHCVLLCRALSYAFVCNPHGVGLASGRSFRGADASLDDEGCGGVSRHGRCSREHANEKISDVVWALDFGAYVCYLARSSANCRRFSLDGGKPPGIRMTGNARRCRKLLHQPSSTVLDLRLLSQVEVSRHLYKLR